MSKKYNQKPFRRSDVDPNNHDGWVVDLSVGNTINPDCYWYFRTRKQAREFIQMLNHGFSASVSAMLSQNTTR